MTDTVPLAQSANLLPRVARYRGETERIVLAHSTPGDNVAETLGDRNAVLLRGHGGTVVANDLDTLLRLGIDLVRAARIQIMAASLGAVKTHTHAECDQMVKGHDRLNANRRFIDYYISEVVD